IGTVLFQRYLTDDAPAVRDWFLRLIAGRLPADSPRLANPVPGIRLRHLRLDDLPLTLLLNRTDTPRTAQVRWRDTRSASLVIPPNDLLILPAAQLQSYR